MAEARRLNQHLAEAIAEADWSHAQVAAAFVRTAREIGAQEFARVGRSHISRWVAGTRPSGAAPQILSETISRRLGRIVTLAEIGLDDPAATPMWSPDWPGDALVQLTDLGRLDMNRDRRHFLASTIFALAGLAPPDDDWWRGMAARGASRSENGSGRVGYSDLDAVKDMTRFFSGVDQRRGGGHARSALAQYLSTDVSAYLQGGFVNEHVRRQMFSASSELAYVNGWMAFDDSEHSVAQRYFTISLKLAAEADDPALAGHILRAMAHQALDLGHTNEALQLSTAAVDHRRLSAACPREQSLLGVVHARALVATGQPAEAARILLQAEDSLAATREGDEEPARVFFFGEASLAHETACALRDMGDLAHSEDQFERSIRTRKASTFTRTHAVTLGYLGALQARQGQLERACATWSAALDAMDGVRSGRTRQVASAMISTLSPFRVRGTAAARDVTLRAGDYLTNTTTGQ